MENKIQQLLGLSKNVISDCALENGAIVAANSSKEYYPKDAKNYFYVWPRDGAFSCIAADVIGIKNIQENFFTWLSDRAEGWRETGLFYEKYYPNGLKTFGKCQIDQTGIVIFSIYKHFENNLKDAKKYKKLVVNSANAICDN
jgi:GH15 family glucan-1,4-alpha-glucosidase